MRAQEKKTVDSGTERCSFEKSNEIDNVGLEKRTTDSIISEENGQSSLEESANVGRKRKIIDSNADEQIEATFLRQDQTPAEEFLSDTVQEVKRSKHKRIKKKKRTKYDKAIKDVKELWLEGLLTDEEYKEKRLLFIDLRLRVKNL